LAKNLILWDSIPSSREGVYNQIPALIKFLFEEPVRKIHQKYYLIYNIEVIDFMSVSMIFTGIISGCLLALGVKFAGTQDEDLKKMMLEELDAMMKLRVTQCEFSNDPENKNSVE
jgi:anaphase-promoting complex subunit 1